MKPKIIILLLITIIIGQNAQAQGMPVYDNTNFIALGKSLIESAKQTSELLKTVDFLREQKQRLEQVSSIVKQLSVVREIIDNNQHLFDLVQEDLNEVLHSPHIKPQERDRIYEAFNSIIDVSLEDFNFMQQLLTSNLLSMSDAERLMILESQRERSREMVAEIELKKKRYRTILSVREIQDRINNRESQF